MPGEERGYISIVPVPARVRAYHAGRVLADSIAVLELREGAYPPVLYFPRRDVDPALLAPSDHTSHCPHKGVARYFSLVAPGAGDGIANAAWSYEQPLPAVAAIAGHVAFYTRHLERLERD